MTAEIDQFSESQISPKKIELLPKTSEFLGSSSLGVMTYFAACTMFSSG